MWNDSDGSQDFSKDEVKGCIDQVLLEKGIDPATGERVAKTTSGETNIGLLVESIVSRVQESTPIGKSFARLESAHGQPGQAVSPSDRRLVFERLCVQMLQRTRPSMCPRGARWQEELDEYRRRGRAGFA